MSVPASLPTVLARTAFLPNWPRRLGYLAFALYCLYALSTLEITWARFVQGLDQGQKFLSRLWPPNFAPDKLALMSTVYDRSEAERASVCSRLDLARRYGPHAIISAALTRWFSPEFVKAHPEILNQYEALLRSNDAASFLSAYKCFATADRELVGGLAAFDRPTLVMTGELDAGSTPGMARKLAGVIPGAACSIIAWGRHMMLVEMPEEVNSVLRRFLKGEIP